MAKKQTAKQEIKLGQKVRDTVTGFVGVATSKVEYMNGCVQFCVKPSVDEDGKMQDGHYIDIDQLEVVDETTKRMVKEKPTGGPQADTPKDRYRG